MYKLKLDMVQSKLTEHLLKMHLEMALRPLRYEVSHRGSQYDLKKKLMNNMQHWSKEKKIVQITNI